MQSHKGLFYSSSNWGSLTYDPDAAEWVGETAWSPQQDKVL